MRRSAVILIILFAFSCGCGFFHRRSPAPPPKPVIQSGKVVDGARLKRAGKLLIVPFTAGVNVPASEEVEQISLGIVKGMMEVLQDSPLTILMADNASEAELFVRGHITQKQSPLGVKKWLKGKHKKTLAVKGEMIDLADDQTVVIFSHARESGQKGQTFMDLALALGRDLGQFILAEVQASE